jgi:predicted transposase YbfD/YdcC
LLEIVVIAVCAVMCGADTWVDSEEYGCAKDEWLKRFLPLPQGMPSHDTFARVFARLAPEAFRTSFLAWLMEVQERIGEPLASQLVGIDGKAARHSFDRAIDRGPLHMVSAWATASHLVLGQIAVAPNRNESTAIPTLLQLLELSGCIVTIDAMGTQKELAKTIIEQEADSVLALTGHQGTLHEDVALFFEWADPDQERDLVHQTDERHHTGHGREERRRTTVTHASAWLRGYEDWVGLQTIAMMEASRTQGPRYRMNDATTSAALVWTPSGLQRAYGDTGRLTTRSTGCSTSPFAKTTAVFARGMHLKTSRCSGISH